MAWLFETPIPCGYANKSWAWFLEHPGGGNTTEIWVGVCSIPQRDLLHLGLCNIDLRTALKLRTNKRQVANKSWACFFRKSRVEAMPLKYG